MKYKKRDVVERAFRYFEVYEGYGAALVFPDGEFDGAGGSVRTVEFFFNADGSLTLPAATLIDPVWFTNIEKVGSDLDLEQ